jgi:hypothetical protein
VPSDKRLKKDINAFEDGLDIIKQIKPVRYHYNGKADMPQDVEFIGVLAQDLQKIAPYMVGKFNYQDTAGKIEEYLDYDATALTYILVNSVKEQQKAIEDRDAKIETLETKVKNLEDKLNLIEQLLRNGSMTDANSSEGKLWQNTPNPYSNSTTIKYQVSSMVRTAFIKVYSVTGQELQSFDISGRTIGEVTLTAKQLAAGTYVYKLIVDGRIADSKRLILTR